jgi:uroporphyrin-III C-methyltransferase
MAKFWIVGAGPGRADLLTLRAARALERADAVLYDRLVSAEVLAMAHPRAEFIFVGKEEGRQEAIQQEILEQLSACAHRYRNIVRLKGGDPMVFGRGAEEWQWLVSRGHEVELVPGVSASISVPALAGIPPTFRGVAGGFAVVTGHRRDGMNLELERYARVDTLIILMGVKYRAEIAASLMAAGRPADEPACFIENGATPRERIVVTTLGELGRTEVESPAVLVIGEVVRLREQLVPALAAAVA